RDFYLYCDDTYYASTTRMSFYFLGLLKHPLKFICSNYKEFAKQKRKILFITNLKKNLPIDELKKRFIANGNEEDFEKYVLFIDSNVDPVINNLLNLDQRIPDKFKNKIYLQLKKYIEMLQYEQLPSDFKENIKTDIRKNIEPAFRDIIKRTLSENFKTKKARLLAVKNNQDYQWIGELYPAVFTDDKTILFLSIDKFVAQNTTLIEPSYYFSERFINKSLIFIDEFDTTKEAVLKNSIQSGLRNQVDLIDLFLNIHNHLMQTECPEVLLQESKWRKQQPSAKNWSSLREQIESLREKANYIFKKYQLQHICKSHDNFSTKERNFLFYDYKFHNVLDRNQRVEMIGDINSRTNWINTFNIKDKKTGIDIQELLSTITGYLSYFQTGIKYLANNYRHLKEEDKGGQETFPIKLAIQTVLNNFHLKIEVFFSDGYGKREIKEVSEQTARLSELMKIDSFQKLFTDSGWATIFPKSKLMLTPPMFNNIYKGALGEVCGKHIFQNLLNIPLLELNIDEFELFDFKTEQNIYIDFKLWNDRVAVKADEIIDKISEKMAIVGAERIFVINILGSSNTPFQPIPSFGGKIIEVPYLCKNDKIDNLALKFLVNEFLT
ncbi:MAG: hypothetical protein V7K89_07585, partial [Nostoc sp.]|uniref:hypothetical protein n=1 Tax=Nostoc sp. TaxID=1180 RepID=UPI002FFB679D